MLNIRYKRREIIMTLCPVVEVAALRGQGKVCSRHWCEDSAPNVAELPLNAGQFILQDYDHIPPRRGQARAHQYCGRAAAEARDEGEVVESQLIAVEGHNAVHDCIGTASNQ